MTFKPLRQLHRNEKGEMPIGPILIIALIVLPLIFVLLSFRDTANTELEAEAKAVFEKGGNEKMKEITN
jgi:hypothetical protein